jgi:hypothetical protein
MPKAKIQIAELDYQILIKTLKETIGFRPELTEKSLQLYMQSQYDGLVGKGEDFGEVTLQCPTPETLINWIKENN